MWRGPDNMLHVFLTLMYPLEVESNLFIARFALPFIVYVFMQHCYKPIYEIIKSLKKERSCLIVPYVFNQMSM